VIRLLPRLDSNRRVCGARLSECCRGSWAASRQSLHGGGTAAPVQPTQQMTVGQLLGLAERVLTLLKVAIRVRDVKIDEATQAEWTAVVREAEAVRPTVL